jgi:hypothetical protein
MSRNISSHSSDDPILSSVHACLESNNFMDVRDRPEVASIVLEGVSRLCPKKSEISNVRTRLFDDPETESSRLKWLRIQWDWKTPAIDVTAIFLLDFAPCSHVIIFGAGELAAQGRQWQKTWLKWVVGDIDHLRLLFRLAHLSMPGISKLSGCFEASVSSK